MMGTQVGTKHWLARVGLCVALGAGAHALASSRAEAAGFGGHFQRLITSAPQQNRATLEAARLLVRKSFRVLGADPRIKPLRRGLYKQFQLVLRRALASARIHGLRAGSGLLKTLRADLHRAWHLTGRYVKRKLGLPKIPAVFATVRRKTNEGFGVLAQVQAGQRRFSPDMFNALFPRTAPSRKR